jgi:hypothetical protein
MGYVEDLEKRCEDLESKLMDRACVDSYLTIHVTKKKIVGRDKFNMTIGLKLFEGSQAVAPIGSAFHTTLDEKKVWYIEYADTMQTKQTMDPKLNIEEVAQKMAKQYNLSQIRIEIKDDTEF